MIHRCILPVWAQEEYPSLSRVQEGEFSPEKLKALNEQGYNIYLLPNYPSKYLGGKPVDGADIDIFRYAFLDMDLKDGTYANKEEFITVLNDFPLEPTLIVDSGNGIHAYFQVNDLTAESYLRFQRRLCRKFKTDEAVCKIYQLMRLPGYYNTKKKDDQKLCVIIHESDNEYTSEQLDKALPIITKSDEEYCVDHYNKTYDLNVNLREVDEKIPLKFLHLIRDNKEVKEIWSGNTDDRSKSDFRLGHVMFANGLTKDEALSVLVNSAKALSRSPKHRISYASNIVEQIWTYELEQTDNALTLSSSVKEILQRKGDTLKGTRFPCHRYIDATNHGFRLGQVIGLVAGSGVGKTAMALNMFMGFVKNNPDYQHFFVPLEQPANEIADRWRTMCGNRTELHEKVHIISNYAEDGSFRHLSLTEIKDYILKFQKVKDVKVGCIVIDHIGALKKKGENGENQGLMDICHEMKAFAVQTNTMVVMQSQAPREKAGIGDLELNKDAAYGTVYFESYCDYLVTIWQPLKRCYSENDCPTVTSFKFCKIRHKKTGIDEIHEDVPYNLYFDPTTEHLREMLQGEEDAFRFYNVKSTNMRKQDRKTDVVTYQSITWTKGDKPDAENNSYSES